MFWLTSLLLTCGFQGAGAAPGPEEASPPQAPERPTVAAPAAGAATAADTVGTAFPPPPGAARVDGGAFGAWLQSLQLREDGAPVRTYDGRVVAGHRARVIELPLVDGDLQQCADSIIRVRSEWLRETDAAISWRATSGDPLPWDRYRAGERPRVVDDRIQWRAGGEVGEGDAIWEGYLRAVFTWAGTASMEAYETTPLDGPGEARPGDVLVRGGFPGHAVLLLDVAARGDEVWVLIGEGFMPAQDFHVEIGPEGGWWRLDEGGLALPHWSFGAEALRRLN